MRLTPYLNFDGTCAAAFKHYASVFGGELVVMTFRGSPMEAQCTPEQLDRVMHARINAPGLELMGSDVPSGWFKPMEGLSVNISADTAAEAERLWAALSEGGQVRMQLEETFWAERFGMFVDQFGTPWMINCEKKPG